MLLKFSIKALKWLCIGAYKAPSQNDKYFTDNQSKILGQLTHRYDKTMFIAEIKLADDNKNLEFFYECFQPGMFDKQSNLFSI